MTSIGQRYLYVGKYNKLIVQIIDVLEHKKYPKVKLEVVQVIMGTFKIGYKYQEYIFDLNDKYDYLLGQDVP